jgi:hypothetical protein
MSICLTRTASASQPRQYRKSISGLSSHNFWMQSEILRSATARHRVLISSESQMAEYPIDFKTSCQKEADGSLTMLLHVSGLPDLDAANKVSLWMRDIIRENAHKIGRRGEAPRER